MYASVSSGAGSAPGDHSLVFTIRKIHISKKQDENIVEIRNMKNFDDKKFVEDLLNQHWEYVYFFADNPNTMWEIWKKLFEEVLISMHPFNKKRSDKKKSLGLLVKSKSL